MIIQILCISNLTSIPVQATGSFKVFSRKMFTFIIQAEVALKTTLLRKPGRHRDISELKRSSQTHAYCTIPRALDDTPPMRDHHPTALLSHFNT